jgi:hypothetical protein
MNHNLMLTWVSERGNGSWVGFREAHEWLSSASDGVTGSHASTTARMLSMLGYMEIDWHERRWAVAPTVLTMLPEAGGYALLAGCRTRPLMKRVREIVDGTQSLIVEVREQANAPSTVFIGCENEDDVAWLASELGVAFVSSVSDQLSGLLPSLLAYLRASPPSPAPRGAESVRFDAHTLRWRDATDHDAPGLYRFEVYGRPEYRWRSGALLAYDVDYPVGIYLELSRQKVAVLEHGSDGRTGTLRCPVGAPMPTLHARAAALCNGMAPRRENGMDVFVNVPELIARRIASSLSQTLKPIDDRRPALGRRDSQRWRR